MVKCKLGEKVKKKNPRNALLLLWLGGLEAKRLCNRSEFLKMKMAFKFVEYHISFGSQHIEKKISHVYTCIT